MILKKILSIAFLSLVLIPLSVINSSAAGNADLQSREYDLGIEAGIFLPGTITIEDVDLDKDPGPLLRVFADMYVAPKFAVGAYGNYSSASLSKDDVGADATMWELGVSFKPKFMINPDTAVKPGLNIGYRHSSIDIDGFDPADGLGINLSVELQFAVNGGYIFFIDGGFLSQPVGGNSDADVTWPPILYICGGIAF